VSRNDDNAHLRDLEQCVIGAVLLSASVIDLLPSLACEDFHDFRARGCWEAIRSLQSAGHPVDTATIESALAKSGRLDAIGLSYVAECAMRVPSAENAVEYARLIRDASLSRQVRVALSDVLESIKRDRMGGAESLSLALAAMSKLDTEQPDDAVSIGEWVRQRLAQLEVIAQERASGKTTMTGFPTGVAELDATIGGWQPGIVSIVAARPAMGKSSLALATADASSQAGFGVHVFSLEDSRSAYADRSMSRQSGVPAESMRNATMSREQLASLSPAIGRLRRRPQWLVDDRSGITADEVVRSVRRRKRQNATRVVVVDYIQLLKWPRESKSAHDAITANVTTLADAAKQDGIAYVVLSQLNRAVEQRADKRPQLADLRESGSLEERSKCVVGMYRGSYYGGEPKRGIDYDCGCQGDESRDQHKPSQHAWDGQLQCLVLKNSNGRTGRVWAGWDGSLTKVW
jgi:replicative DNA helicase